MRWRFRLAPGARLASRLSREADRVEDLAAKGLDGATPEALAAAERLASAATRLAEAASRARRDGSPALDASRLLDSQFPTPPRVVPALTRSAILDAPSSAEFASPRDRPSDPGEMIGRLEPDRFLWIDASPSAVAFFAYPPGDLRRLSFLDLVHRDDRDLAAEQLRAAIDRGEAHGLIYRLRTARGEGKAVEVNVGIRYAPTGAVDHLRCHLTDVTDRLRADRELRRRTRELLAANGQLVLANRQLQELKDLYGDLYQNAPAMYFSLDESGSIRECNNTLLATLGYRREDLIGRPYVYLLPAWRRPAFGAHFARFLSTGRVEVESQWIKADGESIDVHIAGTAILGPDGTILRSRSVAQDITARKLLESQLEEKNARLARAVEDLARKNKELDDFCYSVSHDLQEPLRTLVSFSGLLLADYGDCLSAEGREHLEFVLSASKRMRTLVADLLALSRAGKAAGSFGPIDLDALMAQVRRDLSAALAETGAELEVSSPLPPAWGDRDRVGRLLGNLVSNALKYNRPGELPRVRVWAEAGPGGAVTIAVKDHGIGIDPLYHAAIFQLFRRLHARDEYEGNGAGLTICKVIAEAHKGTISVESAVGQGATFRVFLPGPPGS